MFKIRITVSKSIYGPDSTNLAKMKFKEMYCLNCFEIERFVQQRLWLTNKQSQLLDPSLLSSKIKSLPRKKHYLSFQAYWYAHSLKQCSISQFLLHFLKIGGDNNVKLCKTPLLRFPFFLQHFSKRSTALGKLVENLARMHGGQPG